MKKQWITAVVGALVVVGSLTACGSSKSGSSSGGASEADYCVQVKAYKDKADQFDAMFQNPEANSMKVAFETMQGILHDLDKNPPSTIAGDVHKVRGAIDQMIEVFTKYDYDFVKLATAPEFAELSKVIDGPEFKASTDRLDQWGVDTCGFPPDSTVASSTETMAS